MPSMQKISWKRLVAESTAIVASILLAFAIQAWWENRQEDRSVAAYLKALSTELDQIETDYKNHIAYLKDQDNKVLEIMALASNPDVDAQAQLGMMVWNLGPFSPLRPSLAALSDLQGVGLQQLGSVELRKGLVSYRNVIAIDSEEQESFSEYWRNSISPYWDELFNISDWLIRGPLEFPESVSGELVGLPVNIPRVSLDVPHERILKDRLFLNQMSRRLIRSWRIRSRHVAVLDETARLKQLIANEL